MIRYLVNDQDLACEVLNEANIPFDLDGGDRIMIDEFYQEEAEETFMDNDIVYDIV